MNQAGEITGFYRDEAEFNHGFVREPDGTITSFDPVGSANTFSFGVNDSGATTGYYFDIHDYGFIRDAQGNFVTFDASVGGSGFGTYPLAIGDGGEVVGSSRDQANENHSFLRDSKGNVTSFDPPGAQESWALGFGPNGEILGYALLGSFYGYIRDSSGNITTFTVPGNQSSTLPFSVNRAGQISGTYYDRRNVTHGFVRDSAGNFTTFDAPGGGNQNSQGTDAGTINEDGAITGYVVSSRNNVKGFIRNSSGTIELFRAPGAGGGKGQGTYSGSINHRGEVSGLYIDASGIYHGFTGH